MELFKNLSQKGEEQNQEQGRSDQPENQEQEREEVTLGTKIKVVAALLVVGFAGYIAYWIQEPVEVRTDLLGSSSMQNTQTASGTEAMSGTMAMTQMQAGETQQVSIENFSFNPATVNASKGTTVVWTNNDNVPHNVVGDNFSSPTLNPGDSFSYTFNDEGSFAYKCTFHPQMKGYVIVGTPTGGSQANADQVLSGFGAGSAFSTGTGATQAPLTADQTASQQAVSAPAETTPPVAPEQLYVNSAPAPSAPSDLHNAPLQSLSESLSNVGTAASNNQATVASSAQGSTPLTQQVMSAPQNAQVEMPKKGKLASSGPEDYLYAGIFGLILILNRKKLSKLGKSLR